MTTLELSVAAVAAAMADPSRVKMLCALMDGRAWTATELSVAAGVAASTASAHLSKLVDSQLVCFLSQGRHRYYRLAGKEVARLIEMMMGISWRQDKPLTTRTPVALRHARTCYDHLAGELAVSIYDALVEKDYLTADGASLTEEGLTFLSGWVCHWRINQRVNVAVPVLTGVSGAFIWAAMQARCCLFILKRRGGSAGRPGFVKSRLPRKVDRGYRRYSASTSGNRHKKTRFTRVLSQSTTSGRLSQFADLCSQVCFMTRSFVFVDQTFSGLAIHDRLHFVKCFLCSSFVASFDRSVHFLDESTHHRATACVVFASLFRLNGALLS
jgi:DNA-binding transcriptional ArsR family regulator